MAGEQKFCERIMFTADDAANVNTLSDLSAQYSKIQVIQVQRLTVRSYSSTTKLMITPSIPFKMKFNGQDIVIKRMSLYHPCPVRIENRQADAVLSLNDPIDDPEYVILIPLEGESVGRSSSAKFISKIASYIPGIISPEPDGSYKAIDVPTDASWTLKDVLKTKLNETTKQNEVVSGFYTWRGEPPYEKYLKERRASPFPLSDYVIFGWKPSQQRSPRYILAQYPAKINAFDLQTIRMLPVTPAEEAIHPIPTLFWARDGVPPEDSPAFASFKEKCGTKETFTVNAAESAELSTEVPDPTACDPFAQMPPQDGISTDTIVRVILGVLSAVAVFIGIYFALKYVTTPFGDFFKQLGEKLAKAINGTAKKIKKVSDEAQKEVEKEEKPTKQEEGEVKTPAALEGVIEPAEKKPEETFAFSNPIAQKKVSRSTSPGRRRETQQESEAAAGTGLLTPEQLKTEPELRKFVNPNKKKRVIAEEATD